MFFSKLLVEPILSGLDGPTATLLFCILFVDHFCWPRPFWAGVPVGQTIHSLTPYFFVDYFINILCYFVELLFFG